MLSEARNSSTWSCGAQASQAAPDLSPGCGEVQLSGAAASPGNLFAEFVNSGPFIHHQLECDTKVFCRLHSGLDLLAAVLTLIAVKISSKPADSRHPYGHGKAENLSALAQTLLLFGTCAWVVYEGVHRLTSGGSPVVPSLWGVGVMAFSMAVDINRVRVLRRVAKTFNSQALEADALHFSTDILSSAVVLVGVLAVWLAQALHLPEPLSRVLSQADTVAALLVAVIIFRASMHMASDAVDMLMDTGSSHASESIAASVKGIAGISEVRRVRVRTSGPQNFVDLTVGVAPGLKVSDGHRLAHEAEQAVAEALQELPDDYHVFHDLEFPGFNIDHVVVAPTGVFSIETKTRRKPIDKKKGRHEYEITYDGERLIFPVRMKPYDALEQTQQGNNAEDIVEAEVVA